MQGRRQAWLLRGLLGGMATTMGEAREGRHKACPYRTVGGLYCWLDTLLGKNTQGG